MSKHGVLQYQPAAHQRRDFKKLRRWIVRIVLVVFVLAFGRFAINRSLLLNYQGQCLNFSSHDESPAFVASLPNGIGSSQGPAAINITTSVQPPCWRSFADRHRITRGNGAIVFLHRMSPATGTDKHLVAVQLNGMSVVSVLSSPELDVKLEWWDINPATAIDAGRRIAGGNAHLQIPLVGDGSATAIKFEVWQGAVAEKDSEFAIQYKLGEITGVIGGELSPLGYVRLFVPQSAGTR